MGAAARTWMGQVDLGGRAGIAVEVNRIPVCVKLVCFAVFRFWLVSGSRSWPFDYDQRSVCSEDSGLVALVAIIKVYFRQDVDEQDHHWT